MTKFFARLAWKRGSGEERGTVNVFAATRRAISKDRALADSQWFAFPFEFSTSGQKLLPIPQVCCHQNFISFVTFMFGKA